MMSNSNNNDADLDDMKKQGTREKETAKVFKKSSPNGKITAYLGKRDFIDYHEYIDPVDGVVLIEPDYLKDRKVFVHVLAAFRYGREDLDVLGLTFRKDLFLASQQVYPPINKSDVSGIDDNTSPLSRKLTRLQERLIKKLGQNAYPFYFELPHNTPASVTLQPGPNDNGKPCGVDYELKTYVAENPDEKAHKRNSVKLAIRKLTYAADKPSPQPSAEVVKDFIMSPGSLKLEASLDKEKYYHGESISVNVLVDNNSNKTIKKIKIAVRQHADICLYNTTSYKCVIDEMDAEDGFPIYSSQTGWCKVYKLCPLLSNNRDKRGLALDGKLKHEDTNLASSTIINETTNKENLGIIVQYKVKVRLVLGFGTSDVSVELPFTLSHPKPVEDEPLMSNFTFEDLHSKSKSQSETTPLAEAENINNELNISTENSNELKTPILDPDLIQLDATWDSENKSEQEHFLSADDDLIFEDFARLRLTGGDKADS